MGCVAEAGRVLAGSAQVPSHCLPWAQGSPGPSLRTTVPKMWMIEEGQNP